MADIVCVERIALYDNSREDENNRDSYIRLPWDLVTMSPGLNGAPKTTFLEPVPVNLSSTCMTVSTAYHKIDFVDAKSSFGSAVYGTGGENAFD